MMEHVEKPKEAIRIRVLVLVTVIQSILFDLARGSITPNFSGGLGRAIFIMSLGTV